MNLPSLRPVRYGTSEVAAILGTDDWRIRNFATAVYGLEPTVKANGRGSRRYYGFEAVLRLAVANELYEIGCDPSAIKRAIEVIDNQKVIPKWMGSFDDRGRAKSLTLMLGRRKNKESGKWERLWRVENSDDARDKNSDLLEGGFAVVSLELNAIWKWMVQRITELEGEGRL